MKLAKPPRKSGRSLTAEERKANGQSLVQGLWLPAELVQELDRECKRLGTNRTAMVAEALGLLLKKTAKKSTL